MPTRSPREEQFLMLWQRFGPKGFELVTGYRFHPTRKWAFDVAFPAELVAVEIEGVTYFGARISRHQTTKGYQGDLEKYNAATELGWRLLRYTQRDLDQRPLQMLEQITRVLRPGGD